jgi:hypothetical protein
LTDELHAAGTDHTSLARVGRELADAEGELAVHEDEWLALAEEAESD